MTENLNQPRTGDGRFSETERPAVDLDLTPVPQGSFLFPAILEDAKQTIAFFERVEISDDVCMKVSSSYVASREVTQRSDETEWWDDAEKPFRERNGIDVSDRARDEYLVEARDAWTNLPEYLDPRDARAAAKVIGMMKSAAGNLDRAERDVVGSHLVATTTGPVPARDLFRNWGLGAFENAIVDPSAYDQDAKLRQFAAELSGQVAAGDERTRAEIAEELAKTRAEISREAEETRTYVDGSLHQTGSAIIDAI